VALRNDRELREYDKFKADTAGDTAVRTCVTEGTINAIPDGPIQIGVDGTATDVNIDTGTPANTVSVPVVLTGSSGPVNITAGDLNVQLSHLGANFDSTRIGDGTETASVNTSNELNVRDDDANTTLTGILSALGGGSGEVTNTFGLVTSVAASTSTSVVSFTVPVGKEFFLQHIEASGTNIAQYDVFMDAARIARKRTFFGGAFNTEFFFVQTNNKGLKFIAGEKVELKVEHFRSMVGDFEGRIVGILE